MVKEDVEDRKFNCNLEYLNLGGASVKFEGWFRIFKPKSILGMTKPVWPSILEFAAKCKNLIIDMDQCKWSAKDMELLAYTIGENPHG